MSIEVKLRRLGGDRLAADVESKGRRLALRFKYDRVPPEVDDIVALSGSDGTPLEVEETAAGEFEVAPPADGGTVTLRWREGVGGASLDEEASGEVSELERAGPERPSLGQAYQNALGALNGLSRAGAAPSALDLEAKAMWLGLDLGTTAFQSGELPDDAKRHLEAALGSVPINFDGHSRTAASLLQNALHARMMARLASNDPLVEPPLELGSEDGVTSFHVHEAGRRAGVILMTAMECKFPLDSVNDEYTAPDSLWYAMLGFASGSLFMEPDPAANGQFNCSPNGIAVTLFAEYARAACEWAGGRPPFIGTEDGIARWRALWPIFVAMIDAFNDSYHERGARRTVDDIGSTADRAGTSPWTARECNRAKAYYSSLSDEDLLRQWHRLLRALNRDAPTA
ncbi:MAG: hypothetical protein AAF726_08340 [Planctomycetota bacterium]